MPTRVSHLYKLELIRLSCGHRVIAGHDGPTIEQFSTFKIWFALACDPFIFSPQYSPRTRAPCQKFYELFFGLPSAFSVRLLSPPSRCIAASRSTPSGWWLPLSR